MDDPRFKLQPTQQMLSALSGAIATSLTITPMEVIKTRMQILPGQSYMRAKLEPEVEISAERNTKFKRQSLIQTFRIIHGSHGFRGFYSGLIPTLLGAIPSTVLYFVAYEQFKRRLILLRYNENLKSLPDISFFVPIISGVSARILTASLCTPFEMVRIKMQAKNLSIRQVSQVARHIIQTRGAAGLWYGLVPGLLRDTPFTAIYWTCYESLKAHYNVVFPTIYFSLLAGALSGSAAATLTTPLDVVHTRAQNEVGEAISKKDPRSMIILSPNYILKQLIQIFRTEGLKGLFSGLSLRLARTVPACAIMISVYECGTRFFYNRNRVKSES